MVRKNPKKLNLREMMTEKYNTTGEYNFINAHYGSEEGTFTGVFVDAGEMNTKYGISPVYYFQDATGEKWSLTTKSKIFAEIVDLHIEAGDEVNVYKSDGRWYIEFA